ncbi:MAG: nucleotide pyrophosphohydrolase [Armatimonadetes bacterium]|nr:nucleotide pyrophosphohydrolase [Armatimonadota bacterium]
MTIREFQTAIEDIYLTKDRDRGIPANIAWLVEELGELAQALRKGSMAEAEEEFADVLAWLCTLASIAGVDLEEVAGRKYAHGCPKCGDTPCTCPA